MDDLAVLILLALTEITYLHLAGAILLPAFASFVGLRAAGTGATESNARKDSLPSRGV